MNWETVYILCKKYTDTVASGDVDIYLEHATIENGHLKLEMSDGTVFDVGNVGVIDDNVSSADYAYSSAKIDELIANVNAALAENNESIQQEITDRTNAINELQESKADTTSLDNYYTKNETYTKTEVDGKLNNKADTSTVTEIDNTVTGIQTTLNNRTAVYYESMAVYSEDSDTKSIWQFNIYDFDKTKDSVLLVYLTINSGTGGASGGGSDIGRLVDEPTASVEINPQIEWTPQPGYLYIRIYNGDTSEVYPVINQSYGVFASTNVDGFPSSWLDSTAMDKSVLIFAFNASNQSFYYTESTTIEDIQGINTAIVQLQSDVSGITDGFNANIELINTNISNLQSSKADVTALNNYYTKTENYTKTEVDGKLNSKANVTVTDSIESDITNIENTVASMQNALDGQVQVYAASGIKDSNGTVFYLKSDYFDNTRPVLFLLYVTASHSGGIGGNALSGNNDNIEVYAPDVVNGEPTVLCNRTDGSLAAQYFLSFPTNTAESGSEDKLVVGHRYAFLCEVSANNDRSETAYYVGEIPTTFDDTDIQNSISTINNSISSINTNIDTVEGNISTIQSTLGTVQTNITTLQTDKADAADVYTKSETDNKLAQKANASAVASIETDIDELQADVASAQADITALQTDKADKPVITSVSAASPSVTLTDNTEARCSAVTLLTLTLPSSTGDDYISAVVFTANSDTPLSYPDTIVMVGTDCIDGVFAPVSGKRYEVIVTNDGASYVGRVSGYEVTA